MLLFFDLSASPAAEPESYCSDGTCFPASVTISGEEVPLRGAAHFTYWGFQVYSAAFYAPPNWNASDPETLKVPARLVLRYHRDVTVEDIRKASERNLKNNPDVDRESFRAQLERFYALCRDVEEGDRYEMTLVPDEGFVLRLNGEGIGKIEDLEFGRVYLGVWLSDYPLDREARRQLLGLEEDDFERDGAS